MTDLKVIEGGADDYEMTDDEIIAKARMLTRPEQLLLLSLLKDSIARDEKIRMKRKASLRLVSCAKPA
jgi:hypothetical protein